jgi:hypothetical protein
MLPLRNSRRRLSSISDSDLEAIVDKNARVPVRDGAGLPLTWLVIGFVGIEASPLLRATDLPPHPGSLGDRAGEEANHRLVHLRRFSTASVPRTVANSPCKVASAKSWTSPAPCRRPSGPSRRRPGRCRTPSGVQCVRAEARAKFPTFGRGVWPNFGLRPRDIVQ